MRNVLYRVLEMDVYLAQKGQAFRAAYCYDNRVTVREDIGIRCTTSGGQSRSSEVVSIPVTTCRRGYRDRVVSTGTICVPEKPYRPATPAYSVVRFGWDAGARSIATGTLGDIVTFKANASFDPVLVGLAPVDSPGDQYYYDKATHAFEVGDGRVAVIESGVERYSDDDIDGEHTFRIVVLNGAVQYFIDDTAVYVSSVPAPDEWVIDSNLFLSGTVYDPSITPGLINRIVMSSAPVTLFRAPSRVRMLSDPYTRFGAWAAKMSALSSSVVLFRGTRTVAAALSCLSAPVIQFNGQRLPFMSGSTPAMRAILSMFDRMDLVAAMPSPIRMNGLLDRFRDVSVAGIAGRIPMSYLDTVGQVGAIGNLSKQWPSAVRGLLVEDGMEGGHLYGYTPKIEMFGQQEETGALVDPSRTFMTLCDAAVIDFLIAITIDDRLGVGATAQIYCSIDTTTLESLGVSDPSSLSAVLSLAASGQLMISNSADYIDPVYSQYSVNTASGAVSRYEGFKFDGFTRDAGSGAAYAWRQDGLYAIEDDSGEVIRGLIDLGATDFGTTQLKRVDEAFVGVTTDGDVYLKVIADRGRETFYQAKGCRDGLRAQMAKGIAGRQWTVELEIVDATHVELLDVEFNVGVSARRLTR